MASHTNEIVPPFDFTAALRLSPEERMRQSVRRIEDRLSKIMRRDRSGIAPVPHTGASESELRELEVELGIALPTEYRAFLRQWRYLQIDDGREIWGFSIGDNSLETPWVSDQHRDGVNYLVFGNYWEHADGDQLLFDLSETDGAVVVYLHEHGPLFESFAPSFSLALWRMTAEWAGDD